MRMFGNMESIKYWLSRIYGDNLSLIERGKG
jgi:hypothetical protein